MNQQKLFIPIGNNVFGDFEFKACVVGLLLMMFSFYLM